MMMADVPPEMRASPILTQQNSINDTVATTMLSIEVRGCGAVMPRLITDVDNTHIPPIIRPNIEGSDSLHT